MLGTIPATPPVKLNPTLSLQDPFNLAAFIADHRAQIDGQGFVKLFQRDDYTHQFQVSKLNTARTFMSLCLVKLAVCTNVGSCIIIVYQHGSRCFR